MIDQQRVWDERAAQSYDTPGEGMFAADVLGPTVETLARLADGGRALEFAVGTGRVALALREAGVDVTGLELSHAMIARLREKATEEEIRVVQGDMATASAGEGFALVYLVYNTIANLLSQDEQVECFRNAARHLAPGGRFLIELWVPGIRRFPPGQAGVPFDISDEHVGFDTFDMATQRGTSHHYRRFPDGRVTYGFSNFRYIWPAECDLMARLAGLTLEQRVADWDGAPFTGDSESHISVWRKPA